MAEASTNGSGDRNGATNMEFVAPPEGLRIGGRTYRGGETVPAKYGRQKERGRVPQDPAWNSPYAPPNFGRAVLPNIYTYGSMQSLISKTYRNPDEAMRHNVSNARAMRRDLVVEECLEARQRGTLLLDWHLETEDKKDPAQKLLVEQLTRVVASIRDFTEYRRNLMDAIWYGRNGVQNQFGFQHSQGQRWTIIKDWKPINGDKIVFRYDDGSGNYDPEQVGIKTNFIYTRADTVAGDRNIEMTEQGPVYFLEKWERPLWAIHKHIIEDGLYEDVLSAGRVHGVGIRDRIYWAWFQKQEALAMMMELVERTGNGFTVYYYQYGNPEAKREMTEIAANHGTNNRILIPRLVGDPSMDSNGIEVIPANTSGIDALKELVHEFFGHQIKRYILGQTLSSESSATGLGSGVADLHMESFLQIIKYDSRKLEETITREVIEPLKRFNFPWARDIPVWFKIDTESTEPEQKLQAVLMAWQMGAKIKTADVMSLVGLSIPTADDEFLQNPQFSAAAMGAGATGQPGDPAAQGGAGGAQSYDPTNNEHLFGRALQAAGVKNATKPGSDGAATARYKISHAPEGGATGSGKEYKGGQFTPENAAAKGKQPDDKGVQASADQQAREAGMLKHGFIDKPITDAERGQLWALAKANVGDPAIPKPVRGMFVTLQMLKETQLMGVATTDKIDPKIAQQIYGWMKQNAGQDIGGGHIRDLGNGKLGFSAKAGALILAPKKGGGFDATYSSMTHVVRSAGTGNAQNYANVPDDDGFGPELGAEEMQVEADDDYGPELGADDLHIEDVNGDLIDEDGEPADQGDEPTAQELGDEPPGREPGDEDDDDADFDPSGFGPQPKFSGPARKPGYTKSGKVSQRKLDLNSEIGRAIADASDEYKVNVRDLDEAVDHLHAMHMERLEKREAAKEAVRKWWGVTQRDINRLENQGKDWTSLKGFDVIARAAATSYPELGIGMGRVDLGDGTAREDEGLDEALWNALKEGKVKPPTKMDVVREAAAWLKKSKQEEARSAEENELEMASVPFRKRIAEEFFRTWYGAKKYKPAKGQGGFDFDNLTPVTDANGHVHAPKGGATVNGKDFEGGEFIPPGDVAAATDEEKQDLKGKQVEAIAESMRKSAGGGSTNLFGDEVRAKPKPTKFENDKTRQPKMFSGMDALPGQTDLFDDLDVVNGDNDDEVEPDSQPESEPQPDPEPEPEPGIVDDSGAPWMMTRKDWIAQGGSPGEHARSVRDALREGKDVPDEVLNEAGDGVWPGYKAVSDWDRTLKPEQRAIREAKPVELTERDYLEQRRLSKIAGYLGGIPQLEAQLKQRMSSKQRTQLEASLAYWKEDIKKYQAMKHGAEDGNINANSWRRDYEKLIKEGISKGLITDTKIIGQRPEFTTALNARKRYEKGRHTSFANKSIAVDSSMKPERGYKIKRQDGKEMTDDHREAIGRGIDDIEKVFGPLKDVLDHTDITIAHTNGKHPFLSTAAGLYHVGDKTITVGFKSRFTGKEQKALAHELAHWLDYEAGHAAGRESRVRLGTKSHALSALSLYDDRGGDQAGMSLLFNARRSMNDELKVRRLFKTKKRPGEADTPEQQDEQETLKVALGPYWHSPHEIFARLVEQYVSDELGENGGNSADKDYSNQMGWWKKDVFEKFKPEIKRQVERRLDILRASIARKDSGNG